MKISFADDGTLTITGIPLRSDTGDYQLSSSGKTYLVASEADDFPMEDLNNRAARVTVQAFIKHNPNIDGDSPTAMPLPEARTNQRPPAQVGADRSVKPGGKPGQARQIAAS